MFQDCFCIFYIFLSFSGYLELRVDIVWTFAANSNFLISISLQPGIKGIESFPQTLIYNFHIFVTKCRRPLIFQTNNSDRAYNVSMKVHHQVRQI